MSLLSKIAGFFRPTPKLRNKPGGMAWVQGLDCGDGDRVLNGRAVKTVRLDQDGFWIIDPALEYVIERNVFYTNLGYGHQKGVVVQATAICDERLEPWKDIPDGADESLWELAPKREVLALPVRTM